MRGKITKINSIGNFFFIDNEYWCHFNDFSDSPDVGDEVEYDQSEYKGKKSAKNVRLLKKSHGPISDYLNELENGYFNEKGYLKPDLIIKYPLFLAKLFGADRNLNKSAQVSKFYYVFKQLENLYKIKKDFDYVNVELQKYLPIANKSFQRNHISKDFATFLIKNIEMAIKSEKDFLKGFIPHMQSFMGYYENK